MKHLILPPIAICVCGLSACQNGPGGLTSDFDPMRPPGAAQPASQPRETGPVAGEFVSALLDQTAFYDQRPSSGAEASRLLARGTQMKVISQSGSYVQVELDDGKVGFVPMVMVEEVQPSATPEVPAPDGMLPPAPVNEQPPGGAIPTVIPPDASAVPSGEPAPLPPNGEELKAMAKPQP